MCLSRNCVLRLFRPPALLLIAVRAKMEKKKQKRKAKAEAEVQPDDTWMWLVERGIATVFLCISLFALMVRVAVSLHPYSGAATPPRFGDYEAQRHWMEITLNLPVKHWYRNSTANDLTYWGLDYPPLTAYQSYIHALFLQIFDPDSVALLASRGYESYLGKLLMRYTVLSSDLLIFFPAVLWFVYAHHVRNQSGASKSAIAWHIAMILLSPCLIAIDHGHFQYNCISLGLTMAAIAAILSEKNLWACVLYSLALNHKQMSAYFAPAFFSHLLGKCLRQKNPVLEIAKLGFTVLGAFALIWWPYLYSMDAALEVLSRLAPFERGIYEDYVANFWCTTSILIKWKKLFTNPSIKFISSASTIFGCLPSMVGQIMRPTNKGFLYGLLNSSFVFYLFSFQVHEKSILLPLLPLGLLALEEPGPFMWLTHFAMFSMFPLLRRDKLVLAYMSLQALFALLYFAPGRHARTCNGKEAVNCNMRAEAVWKIPFPATIVNAVMWFLFLCSIVLHVVYIAMNPPGKYPFLFEALIMLLCFSQFVLFTFYFNFKQLTFSADSSPVNREKKYN